MVGHQASRHEVLATGILPERPASGHPSVLPQRQLVVGSHPEAALHIAPDSIHTLCSPAQCRQSHRLRPLKGVLLVVEQSKLILALADEVHARAMIPNPDVAILILHNASCVLRRLLCTETPPQSLGLLVQTSDSADVGGHPQRAVAHLHDVVDVVVPAVAFMVYFGKGAAVRVQQGKSVVGAHPYPLGIVLIHLAHIVAWQTRGVAFPVLVVLPCLRFSVDHG